MIVNQEKLDQLSGKVAKLAKHQEELAQEIHQLQLEIAHFSTTEDFNQAALEHSGEVADVPTKKRLLRDRTDKAISGVCSGIANYFNINPAWIRLLFVVVLIMSFGLFFFLYLLLIIVLPIGDLERTSKQSAPMREKKASSTVAPVKKDIDTPKTAPEKPIITASIERFIGENLISKIGIIIIVIGVAIGAKYSFDNDLISPLARIILGYVVGFGLIGFGIYLKKKYENYSAVLVSGAMAILYFITYFSYDFYGLIAQEMAFGLMVVFTAFTVLAALSYSKQVIAVIGLVGAYVVPFLIGGDNGNAGIFFTYITIVNFGILFVAIKKYWKILYFFSFFASWIIYGLWYGSLDVPSENFQLSFGVALVFFLTFYLAFLGYKVLKKEKFELHNVWLLLVNSFIYYGLGFLILNDHNLPYRDYLGLFTAGNAIIHFLVSLFIYKQKLGDRNLFFLISGLTLVFITIAIPVQLEGNWVTLVWIGEGALLFWIGRAQEVSIYEKLAYPLIILAVFSLAQDHLMIYEKVNFHWDKTSLTPFLNSNFLTSILFIGAFAFIARVNWLYTSAVKYGNAVSSVIVGILLLCFYFTFRIEIVNYWNQQFVASLIEVKHDGYTSDTFNFNLVEFKRIWIINYSLLFTVMLTFINFERIKSRKLEVLNVGLVGLALIVFLTQGLYVISELRENFLRQDESEFYQIGSFNIIIRYISLLIFGLTLGAISKFVDEDRLPFSIKKPLEYFLYISLIWILSSELIHWFDIVGFEKSYKLGLSILWALYSLLLVTLGIWKTKKYLRVGGISFFGFTLVKLFFYDISHLDTISKVIVFMSLGIVLLIVSFLYNKYNKVISDDTPN